jgi:hypothetical protein
VNITFSSAWITTITTGTCGGAFVFAFLTDVVSIVVSPTLLTDPGASAEGGDFGRITVDPVSGTRRLRPWTQEERGPGPGQTVLCANTRG